MLPADFFSQFSGKNKTRLNSSARKLLPTHPPHETCATTSISASEPSHSVKIKNKQLLFCSKDAGGAWGHFADFVAGSDNLIVIIENLSLLGEKGDMHDNN